MLDEMRLVRAVTATVRARAVTFSGGSCVVFPVFCLSLVSSDASSLSFSREFSSLRAFTFPSSLPIIDLKRAFCS